MGDEVKETPIASSFSLTDINKWVLSQTDEEYVSHDWENLKEIIESNDLSILKRKPSDLRRYIKWSTETKAQYGTAPSDYKILLNDWPYGLAPGITHIVVWSRTLIPTESVVGDLTPESRVLIEDFVKKHFVDTLGPNGKDQVLWFKNWVSLQSVRALEHFHVLVRDVDDDTLERWTGERPQRGAQ
ncbi:N-acetylglucosamine-induced protein 1 [Cladobotryum mycophilum]|uniref:N-acetylglucosamine-induced protein 1 n=1 Tax=Cladobotryum mycophilum TaxID=491253 RepID=A0ABR0SAD2_9HYPO